MALSDRIKDRPGNNSGGTPCSMGELINTLEGAELDALNSMLGTPESRGWTANEIHDALRAEGLSVAFTSINHHRGRKCRCFRAAA